MRSSHHIRIITGAVSLGLLLGLLPVILAVLFAPRVVSDRPVVSLPSFLASTSTPWRVQGLPTKVVTDPRILFVGDIMLDRNVARRISESRDPSYPFRKLPTGWFDLYDLAVANLEGPVTDQRRPPVKSIDFQFDPSVIPALKATGLDALSQANNHALDQGTVGFDDSRRRLKEADFLVFGHQVHDDEIALATTTVSGVRFAFLGFNTTDNPLDEVAAAHVISEARAGADRVIVFIHWGSEYKHVPNTDVVARAHWFIDRGVDVVIGGHPHWYQGIESYKGHPIVYSLGNFIFDQDFSLETRQGLAVALTFQKDRISVEPIPIQIDESQPKLVDGTGRTKRLEELAKISDAKLMTSIKEGRVTF